MDEIIRPNWHIAIVHFPIALLAVGTLVEVFSFLGWRRSSLRWAGRWMLLLGAVFSVPTAFSGIYAMSDVARGGIAKLSEEDPVSASRLWTHVLINGSTTVLSLLITTIWIGCSDVWRTRLSLVFKILLLVALVGVTAGAHQGGELVYSSGVGVAKREPTSLPTEPKAYLEEDTWTTMLGSLEQPHAVMAGFVMALACVALGWSIRAIAQDDDPTITEETQTANRIAAAFANESGDLRSLLAEESQAVSHHHTPPVWATKLWLLTFVAGLATVAGGLWIIASGIGTWEPDALWNSIVSQIEPEDPRLTRRLAHFIAGGAIIVCTLMLAILARFGRKSRIGLLLFAPPLVLAMALQIWLGILLLLEGPAGKLTSFTP